MTFRCCSGRLFQLLGVLCSFFLSEVGWGQTWTFNVPERVVETGTNWLTGAGVVSKTGIGTLWLIPTGATNVYTGPTYVLDGVLRADEGRGLPFASTLYLNGQNVATRSTGVLETRGTFSRDVGTAAGQVYWNGTYGGFAARGGDLIVTLNGGAPLLWGAANGFNAKSLSLSSLTADGAVEIRNDIGLGANRAVFIELNTNNANNLAVLSGVISNGAASAFGLTVNGRGTLWLRNTNTFTGALTFGGGTVRAVDGVGLPTTALVTFNNTATHGILESSGSFTRTIGSGAGQISWQSSSVGGGFAAWGGPLNVSLNGGGVINWASGTDGFNGRVLVLNSFTANDRVILENSIELGAARTIYVYDNPFSENDAAEIRGELRGNNTGYNLTKSGPGILELSGFNSYRGNTFVGEGTLRVNGTIASNNYIQVNVPAMLSGTGRVISVAANGLLNYGTVSPQDGTAAGVLRYTGHGTLYTNSRLEVVLGPGTQVGRLEISGNVTIQTNFIVRFRDFGGSCKAEDELTVLTYGTNCMSFPTNSWSFDASLVQHSGRWNWTNAVLVHDPAGKRVYVTGLRVDPQTPSTWVTWNGGAGNWTDWNWDGPEPVPTIETEALVLSSDSDIQVTGEQEAHTLTLSNGVVQIESGGELESYYVEIGGGELNVEGVLKGFERVRVAPAGSLRISGTLQGADLIIEGTNVLESGADLRVRQWVFGADQTLGSNVSIAADRVSVPPALFLESGSVLSAGTWSVKGNVDVAASAQVAGQVRLATDGDMTIHGEAASGAVIVMDGGTLRASEATRVGGLDFTLGGVLIRDGATDPLQVAGPLIVQGVNLDLDGLKLDTSEAAIVATNGYWLSTTGDLNAASLRMVGPMLRVGGMVSISNVLSLEDVTITNPITGDTMVLVGEGRTRDQLVWLAASNSFRGKVQIERGTLRAIPGIGLPDDPGAGAFDFSADTAGWHALLEGNGVFARSIGEGSGDVFWSGHGGFAAWGGDLDVTLRGGDLITWGATNGFRGFNLYLSSTSATHVVTLHNPLLVNGTHILRVFDNPFTNSDYARITGTISMDTAGRILQKAEPGMVWLTGTNTFGGRLQIDDGVVRAIDGAGLPASATLYLNGSLPGTRACGVLESSGVFARNIGTGAGQVYWNNAGGFSAFGGPLEVLLNGGATISWGAANGFNSKILVSGGPTADEVVTLVNPVDLGANRSIYVWDNTNSPSDAFKMAGTLANGGAGHFGIWKYGDGVLWVTGTNTFTGGITNFNGVVRFGDGIGISASASMRLSGGNITPCVFETSGTLTRNLGTEAGQIHWGGSGGFAAWGGDLDLVFHGGSNIVWSALSGGFNGQVLHLGSRTANGRVDLKNDIALNGHRTIYVWDNPFSTSDYARISGTISNGPTAGSQFLRYGDGLLELTATNSYTGQTSLYDGDTRVMGVISGPVVVAVNHTNGPRTILSGIGRVGNLTVQANGIVAPGAGGVGTLTVNGNATIQRGAALEWEIGLDQQSDRIHIISNVTFNAEWVLRVRDGGGCPTKEDRYPVVTFGGFLASNTTTVLDFSLLDEEVWDVSEARVYYDPTNKQVGITGLGYTGPRVLVSDATVAETDSGEVELVFDVTLFDGFMGDVDLYFATADGTAEAGSDYTATSGVVTLTMDWPSTTIVVKVQGDTVPEWPSEYFLLSLAVTGGNARLVRSTAVGKIADDDGSARYKMPIVLSGYTGTETLINFPALVTFREGDGGFSYGQMGHTNGWDLRFLNAEETEELAYEIEQWNRAGTSYVWVRIPRLSGTNTLIWAVWGDATVTEPPVYSTNGTVWSEGFVTVHHFTPPVGGLYRDSGPRNFHGVNEGGRMASGAIGVGLDLNGPTNNVNMTGVASSEQSFTFEMWVRTPSLVLNRYLFDALNGRHLIAINYPTVGTIAYYDGTWRYFPGAQGLNNGEWNHVVVVVDRDAGRSAVYLNGEFVGTNTYNPRVLGGQARIGSQYNAPATQHYDGQMDEFRISDRARSADWIRANSQTQSRPDEFARKGNVFTARGGALAEGVLAVGNRAATGVRDGKATLNGILVGTGGEATAGLMVCWGTADGGTGATGDWEYAASLGTGIEPASWVSFEVDGLTPGQSYAYRFFATNAAGEAWASPAEWFVVPRGWYVATTGDGSDGQSWATAYTNIQQALDAAQPGDEIFLKGERFNICSDPTENNQLLVTTPNLRIRGGYEGVGTPGANDPSVWVTIITRSAGTNRLMLIDGADNVELYGLMFTNGLPRARANPVHPDSSGAGLFIRNANGIRIERCVFQQNWGYGPFVNGGYVYGGGICAVTSRLEIVASRFVSNRVTSLSSANIQNGSGGGIAVVDGELTIEDSEILDNWVAGDYLHGYVDGGGLSIRGLFTARRVVVARNDVGEPSNDARQFGDGIYLWGAGKIENGLFFRNGQFAPGTSGTSNFAVYVAGGYLTMDRCTVTDHKQAGLYRIGGSVVISNSIFWNNNFLDIYENVAGNVIPFYTLTQQGFYDGVNGCFSANPLFADTNTFHLKSAYGTYTGGWFSGGTWENADANSPAIDAGDPLFRADLEPFPNGGRLNLGAYGGTMVASKSPPIAVSNEPASGVSPTMARLNGRIVSVGGYGTEAWFLWDTEDRGGDVGAWSNRTFVSTYDAAGPVTLFLTGLTPETVYYYRLMATNSAGGYALAEPSESFETVLSKPEVANRGVENEAGPTVVLKGEVVLTGGEDPGVYVVWGEVPGGKATGSWENVVYAGFQGGTFSVEVATAPGRSYYYTCYATNSGGEDWAWPPIHFGVSNLFYVSADAVGEGTGQGWVNAFSNLQDALNAVLSDKPTEIYIKGGGGKELQAAAEVGWNRSNVRILGGYEGVGWPGNRDPEVWPTVLTRRPANFIRILSIQGVTNGLLDGVTIRHGNLADFGGGIRIVNSTNLTIANCRIERNKGENATGGTTGGGGVYAVDSFGVITNCLFERNAVTNTAGGGFALGGGLMISNGQWTIRDSQFIYNTVNASGSGSRGRGAGVYIHGGQHAIRNCLFTQNYPAGAVDQATMAQGGAAYLTNTVVAFDYVTVAGNVHEGIHGAQFAEIRHSILWHNGKDLVGTPGVLAYNSISDGDGVGTNGNVVTDPRFEYGFYLGDGSGCRDAASETAAAAGLGGMSTRADGALDEGMADLGYHAARGIGPWHTLYVATDGNDANAGTNSAAPLRSLTRALEKALMGTRVLVAEGLYDKTVETFPLIVDKAGIQLLGTNFETTIVSALNATSRVFHVFEAPWVVLRGMTIRDGVQTTYRYYQQGGGLWIRHSTDLLLDRCGVVNNLNQGAVNENRYGGGIYAENAAFARAINTRFVSNTVFASAGLWSGLGHGGGLYLLRGSWTFERCVFSGNLARGYNNEGALGGAVAILGGTHEFRNSLIVSNSLESRGYGGDGVYSQNATTRVVNCTVADNGWHPTKPAGYFRDGLRQVGTGYFEVRNSIVYGNQTNDLAGFTTNEVGELINVYYTCIGDGQNNGVQGCFQADPLFADRIHYHELSRKGYYSGGFWTGGEWLLGGETSSCIDAGDPNDAYEHEPEPNGKRINLGAYGNTETASKTARPGGTLIIVR